MCAASDASNNVLHSFDVLGGFDYLQSLCVSRCCLSLDDALIVRFFLSISSTLRNNSLTTFDPVEQMPELEILYVIAARDASTLLRRLASTIRTTSRLSILRLANQSYVFARRDLRINRLENLSLDFASGLVDLYVLLMNYASSSSCIDKSCRTITCRDASNNELRVFEANTGLDALYSLYATRSLFDRRA
jgi:hypothetical protein